MSSYCVRLCVLQCPEMVAPYGSYQPIFGTNPFSIGIPTTPRPQVTHHIHYGFSLRTLHVVAFCTNCICLCN